MTIYEFARHVGISTGTVSRVINGRRDVSAETRALVLQRMKELGFRPSPTAQALSTGQSRVISVWMPVYGAYASLLFHALWQIMNDQGFELIVREATAFSHGAAPGARLIGLPVNGSIILDGEHWLRQLPGAEQLAQTPLVNMGAYCDRSLDFVELDFAPGAREAAQHLIDMQCRRIAYMAPAWRCTEGDARRDGYASAMEGAGRAPEYIPLTSMVRSEVGFLLRAYIEARGCPDGIFCYNDDIAVAASHTVRQLNLRVPEDIAIVGADGIEEIEYQTPPISSVVVPALEMCETAWRFLSNRMECDTIPKQEARLVPRLSIRGSSSRR